MGNELYPLTFHPIYKEKIWGGSRFAHLFDRALPPGLIGESWDVTAHPNGMSIVNRGRLAGRRLGELVEEYGEKLLGAKGSTTPGKFPLLMKFIDAGDVLSVQVHPGDEYASLHEPGELGKTELWYVVHSDPGGWLIWGLKPGVDREKFAQAIAAGSSKLIDCLNRVEVKPGEVYPIPAGLVHALGSGVVVAEIQQNSDTTYRVYDWDRVDAEGKPRDLHLDKAMDVIDFSEESRSMTDQRDKCNKYFILDTLEQPAGERMALDDSFHILTPLEGGAAVIFDGRKTILKSGQSCLIPACLGEYRLEGQGVVLCSRLP